MAPCMLSRACSFRLSLYLALLASVSAFYPPTGALSTHALVLCDSLDADVAHLLAAPAPAFPGSLAESRCVAINVCDGQNHRGEAVPIATWLHRSEKALELDGEAAAIAAAAAAGEHYNYYSLQYARVPAGVVLEACEPDFDHARVHGEYVCAANTTSAVTGACPGSVAPTGADLLLCLAALQAGSGSGSGTLAGEAVSFATADPRGSTQMVRYSFAEGWGCFEAADTSAGTTLSQAATPNQVVACGVLEHGAYTEQCAFVCDAEYEAGGVGGAECVHVCGSATAGACATGEYASTTCSRLEPARYLCAACQHEPGQRFLPWSAGAAGQCQYEACPAGTFEQGGACVPCAQHSYTELAAQTACTACAAGTYTGAGGASTCASCFAGEYTGPEPACASGRRMVRSLAEITAFYNGTAAAYADAFDLYAACAADAACLPCAPGSREQGGVCEPCAVGTYQPNFQQTTCFECGAGLTTHSEGRALASECVCAEGFT